jgi:hypothetical protein
MKPSSVCRAIVSIGRTVVLFIALTVIGAEDAFPQDPVADPANDAALARLTDPDMDVRIEALRELQTSLDPRLPELLLPLLSDQGNSIRRLAARGVGSRWHQIPANRSTAYLSALQPLTRAREDYPDVAAMADRAVGLLTRRFEGPMFAVSPDEKWVVYERFGLPCLFDRERNNEELLGWEGGERPGWFALSWGNGESNPAALWDPKSRAVALDMILSRKVSSLWFWVAEGSRLIRLEPEQLVEPFVPAKTEIQYAAGFFSTPRRWFGDEFQFGLYFATQDPQTQEFIDHDVMAGWNLRTGAIREVPESERPAPAE